MLLPLRLNLEATGDVNVALSGVAASPAIGVVAIDSSFALSGVVASAAVGTLKIDVDFALSGVAASAAIGAVTITGAEIALPLPLGAGIGRMVIERLRARRKLDELLVRAGGVKANAQIGRVSVTTEIDLTDDDILALLLAA